LKNRLTIFSGRVSTIFATALAIRVLGWPLFSGQPLAVLRLKNFDSAGNVRLLLKVEVRHASRRIGPFEKILH
jgi:hypothetical protein